MRRILVMTCLSVALDMVMMAPPVVYANHTCSPSFVQSSQPAGSGPASRPTFDFSFTGEPRTFVAQGSQLLNFSSQNYPPGCTPGGGNPCAPTGGTCSRLKGCQATPWSATPPTPLNGYPNVVDLSPPGFLDYAFLSGEDGRLFRVDVHTATPNAASVDTRRASCVADRLLGTPAVQLYAFSNVAFRNDVDAFSGHTEDDVVFVVTATGCGDATHNRVIAYWASDLTKKWEFNAPRFAGEEVGPVRMGSGREGCVVDRPNNRLFCATDAPAGSSQDTLWAFSTINGALLWSDNPGGGVVASPVLFANKLYVVSASGSLWAYSPAGDGMGGPSRLWTTGLMLASPGSTVNSLRVGMDAGTWQGKLLALDTNGRLAAVQDNGTSGSILWSTTSRESAKWVSAPAVLAGPSVSRAFIGRDDGYLQMIDLDLGLPQGVLQIGSNTSDTVFEPGIDADPQTGNAVAVVSRGLMGSTMARVTIPICTQTLVTSGAFGCRDECFLPQGNPPNWNPYCVLDGTCRTSSCRDPGFNPQYNPCKALTSPTSACLGGNYPLCTSGGFACGSQGDVPDGIACDDDWPGAPGASANHGGGTCRADAVPALVACSLPEGDDCDSLGLPRHKCVTKPSVCGSVGGGKCCVCNDGYGMNCNDRCERGQCVSDLYAGCAGGRNNSCIAVGDRACGVNETCCGSNKGAEPSCTSDLDCTASPDGVCLDLNPIDDDPTMRCYYQKCANLSDDPQHCGACGTDCGEYRNSHVPCLDDVMCGSCTTDAECGVLGKCVDGTCGRCRVDVTVAGQPACGSSCTSDLDCGGDKCTNGRCCASGTECQSVGGQHTCQPLTCHRLVNPGTCSGGVCAAGAGCLGPDAGDLAAAGQQGMSSLDFEFTNESDGSSHCRAYVTNYRTDGGPALEMIDQNGAVTAYPPSPADTTHLNGVAVSRDGSDLFASLVNNGGGVPGLALRGPGSATYSRVATAVGTGGADDTPFDQAAFNKGPVGPAFDFVSFAGNQTRRAWLANFRCNPITTDCTCADAGVCRVDDSAGSWRAIGEDYCNQPCSDPSGQCFRTPCPGARTGQRVTAIAFQYGSGPFGGTGVHHRYLVLGHATVLSFYDLDLDAGSTHQWDIDLANTHNYVPAPGRGDSTIEAILSIDPLPSGDIVAEVRGAGDMPAPGNVRNTWLVHVSPQDLSCRHEQDVQRIAKHVNPCTKEFLPPFGFSCPPGLTCSGGACLKPCGVCPGGYTCVSGLCHFDGEVPATFGIGAGSALTVETTSLLTGGNGRLALMPSGKVLRWETAVDQAPVAFSELDTTPSGPLACDDANACTVDSYNASSGQCGHVPVNCADQDLCSVDTCSQATGQCGHAPINCDDGQVCTTDSCNPATGACQHAPSPIAEPGPLQFTTGTMLQWPLTPDATQWNTYRGTIPALMLGSRPPGSVYQQTCFESGDAHGDGATTAIDGAVPPVGTGFYYLVSGKAACESALGHASSGSVIPNTSPCP